MSPVLDHLDKQVRSSQRLLEIVIAQGAAIRKRDVEGVLARLGDVQAELAQRHRLEIERDELIRTAAGALGLAADDVDLDAITSLMPEAEAADARRKSAELKGLIVEIGRIHDQNRVLIRQELAFLDHLMRVLSGTPQAGYSQRGFDPAPQSVNIVDARA